MKVALMTREYPPEVYGGAGVHVEYLARELGAFEEVSVQCWGVPRANATAHQPWTALAGDAPELSALRAVSIDLTMAAQSADADLAHSHTWYANFGGHLAKLLYGIPHVATVHSLEPLRPWKEEQLGGGYRLSSFCERTALENADAVIAVSNGTRARHPARLSRDRPRARARDLQRDRRRRVLARHEHRRARALRDRPGQAVGRLRRAGSRARRASRTCSTRRARSTRGAARAVRGLGRHARARRRGRGQGGAS